VSARVQGSSAPVARMASRTSSKAKRWRQRRFVVFVVGMLEEVGDDARVVVQMRNASQGARPVVEQRKRIDQTDGLDGLSRFVPQGPHCLPSDGPGHGGANGVADLSVGVPFKDKRRTSPEKAVEARRLARGVDAARSATGERGACAVLGPCANRKPARNVGRYPAGPTSAVCGPGTILPGGVAALEGGRLWRVFGRAGIPYRFRRARRGGGRSRTGLPAFRGRPSIPRFRRAIIGRPIDGENSTLSSTTGRSASASPTGRARRLAGARAVG